MWVIYENPKDHPGAFVIREWHVEPGNPDPVASQRYALANELRGARLAVPAGLRCIPRDELDDPTIVEIWV